jgi:hypothetical protein
MKKLIRPLLIVSVLLLFSAIGFADDPPNPGGGPGGGDLPVGGGTSLGGSLLLMIVYSFAYRAFKSFRLIRKMRREE